MILLFRGEAERAYTELSLQQSALDNFHGKLNTVATYFIPLRPYIVIGLDNLRALLKSDNSGRYGGQSVKLRLKPLNLWLTVFYQVGVVFEQNEDAPKF